VIGKEMSNLGRAKNAVFKNLPGDLVIRNGQKSIGLKQGNEATVHVKGRQMARTKARAVAANIMSRACIGMAGLRGRQGQHRQ